MILRAVTGGRSGWVGQGFGDVFPLWERPGLSSPHSRMTAAEGLIFMVD